MEERRHRGRHRAGQGHRPGASGSASRTYSPTSSGTLFFVADDGTNGRELWKSDGTAAGTVLVKDIDPGRGSGVPARPDERERHAVLHRQRRHPRQRSCGRATAPRPAPSWSRTSTPGPQHFLPMVLADVKGRCSSRPTTASTDGSSGRATAPPPAPSWSRTSTRARTNPLLAHGGQRGGGDDLFTARNRTQNELWKSGGTDQEPSSVRDIWPGPHSSFPSELADAGGTLCFSADDGIHGVELWRSDGTAAGTIMVKDVLPGSAPSSPPPIRSMSLTENQSGNRPTLPADIPMRHAYGAYRHRDLGSHTPEHRWGRSLGSHGSSAVDPLPAVSSSRREAPAYRSRRGRGWSGGDDAYVPTAISPTIPAQQQYHSNHGSEGPCGRILLPLRLLVSVHWLPCTKRRGPSQPGRGPRPKRRASSVSRVRQPREVGGSGTFGSPWPTDIDYHLRRRRHSGTCPASCSPIVRRALRGLSGPSSASACSGRADGPQQRQAVPQPARSNQKDEPGLPLGGQSRVRRTSAPRSVWSRASR